MSFFASLLGTFIILQAFVGCSHTVENAVSISIEERAKESSLVGGALHKKLLPTLLVVSLKQSQSIDYYLAEIVKKIFSQDEEARFWTPQIYIIDPNRKKNISWIIPGGYVYLSKMDLKKIQSDSELASIVAYYLAIERIKSQAVQAQEIGELLPLRIDEKTAVSAIEKAMEYIHAAGFDTRGLGVYFNRLQKESTNSIFDPELIDKLQVETRKQYSLRTPVLRSIVRTDAFLRVEKELKNL